MNDEQIIKELGLETVPEAVKEQSLNQVKFIVATRVGGILEAAMNEEQQATFKDLQKGSADKVWQWLDETFVNTKQLTEEVLKDYIQEFNDDLKRMSAKDTSS